MKIIDCKAISAQLRREVAIEISAIKQKHKGIRSPKLAMIMVGDNKASDVYVRNKEKALAECGINCDTYKMSNYGNTTKSIISLIERLNMDETVDGIMLQLPLHPNFNDFEIIEKIYPWKDVDCLTSFNRGLLAIGKPRYIPCTPKGILSILDSENCNLDGLNVVIVGRSELVGKPLAELLSSRKYNATVTLCHSKTKDLKKHTQKADVLISAVGKPGFITEEFISGTPVIIDVGINVLEDGKLCGDVSIPGDILKVRPGTKITPVPGGVGPMTVTSLCQNTLDAYKNICIPSKVVDIC